MRALIRFGKQQQILRAHGAVIHLHIAFDMRAVVHQYIRLHVELCHVQNVVY